jgi:acetolactate synthase-1/3 small subunit
MKHTLSALVENRPGVLAEMTLEFKRRALNIRSISCGETENADISRMVICVDAEEVEIEAIEAAMRSMGFVLQIDDLARREFVDRELVMIKIQREANKLSQIMQIVEVFRASVVGMGESTITVEMSGDEDRVEGLIKLLAPFGIKSMCRTGKIALKRGDE